MSEWILVRDSEVVTYLYNLRESGTELRQAINSLSNGIPEGARKIQDAPETWEWPEARHWITFVVNRERSLIYVAEVSDIRL